MSPPLPDRFWGNGYAAKYFFNAALWRGSDTIFFIVGAKKEW